MLLSCQFGDVRREGDFGLKPYKSLLFWAFTMRPRSGLRGSTGIGVCCVDDLIRKAVRCYGFWAMQVVWFARVLAGHGVVSRVF